MIKQIEIDSDELNNRMNEIKSILDYNGINDDPMSNMALFAMVFERFIGMGLTEDQIIDNVRETYRLVKAFRMRELN